MMKNIFVDGKEIGGNQTYIVAEIGSNHNQSLSLAYESIDAAADCGADAVKFQSIDVEQVYYQPKPKIKELHRKIDMDEKWHWLLSEYCRGRGITFFSAPTYIKAIDIMEEVGVSLYKLASAQIGTFPQLVQKVAATGKPVILSTGIVTTKELNKIVELFKLNKNDKFIILHCVTEYPANYNNVNLKTIKYIKDKYKCLTGYSDHTKGIGVSIGAINHGACVIEKHLMLSDKKKTLDSHFSSEPTEFKNLVIEIENSWKSQGKPKVNISKSERIYKNYRRSIYAFKDIKKGEKLTKNNIKIIRPGYGIEPEYYDLILKRNAKRDIKKGEPLKFNKISK